MRKCWKILAVLFCLLKIGSAQEVSIEYPYKHYTIQDGLVQMQVQCLYQDHKGYLWCGTKTGVSRFDGRTFKNYTSLEIQQGGAVVFIKEDKKNNLQIFSQNNLSILNKDTIVSFDYPDQFHLEYTMIRPEYSTELYSQNKKQESSKWLKVLNYSQPDSLYTDLMKRKYDQILFFDEVYKEIWACRRDTLFRINDHTQRIIGTYISNNIRYIERLGKSLYGFSLRNGIYKLLNDEFVNVSKQAIVGRQMKAIIAPDKETIIIKTDKNLYLFHDKLTIIKKDLTLIRDIMFDKEDNLWVATEEGLYNFFQLNFINYTFGMGNKDWVWSVLEDEENSMWFSSYQNGIWKWDGKEITNYTDFISQKRRKQKAAPYAYFMGASKFGESLYFTTHSDVIEYNGKDFTSVEGIANIMNNAYFFTKTFPDSILYCGGMSGLFEIHPNTKKRQWLKDELDIGTVLSVERNESKDLIVIGSNGIVKIQEDTLIYIQKQSLQNNYGSAKDHLNNIWIGGNQKLEILSDTSIKNILPNSTEQYFSILFMEPHYLLLGGLQGLYVANLNDYYRQGIFEAVLYNQNNGFTGIECAQNGFFIDSEDYVWLPTSDLVTRFDPQKLFHKKMIPPGLTVSTEVSSDNINWQILNPQECHFLGYRQNNFKFRFHAVSFANTGNIRYYHRLEGLQDEWSEASDISEVVFYHLPAGKYKLLVKADPGTSNINSEIISVDFEIRNPFWLTWWFIIILLLILSMIIMFIVNLLNKRVRRQELIKKRVIQLRSDALKAQMNPHLIYNALNNINGLINLGEKEKAQEFLNVFSDMLRLVLESTNKSEITLKNELEIVKSFIEFHKQAKSYHFDYVINSNTIESSQYILIPPMLIQPYVENAILHGFSDKTNREGFIKVETKSENNRLIIIISDNGVGLGNSKHKGTGMGTKLTMQRIQLLEKNAKDQVSIIKLEQGSKVIVNIPLKLKKDEYN